jgi:hypothetical protein
MQGDPVIVRRDHRCPFRWQRVAAEDRSQGASLTCPPVLLPPAIIGDVGAAEGLDDLDHLLALTDQDVSLA